MKHIRKFNEGIDNKQELIDNINQMFKFHCRYIWGIEFDLTDFPNDPEELGLRIDELEISNFRATAGFTAEENCEKEKKE